MQRIFSKIKSENQKYNLNCFFIFLFTFIIYVHNLSPSVFGGDAGDLIAASITRGVAHPSGYPLFTMLGILFLKIPASFSPAWKIGLISSLFSSLTVALMYLVTFEQTGKKWLSIITSLTLAFIYPFWLYAEVAEVIAMHNFFILLSVYIVIKYMHEKKEKYLYLLSLTIGLALTNNLAFVLVFPALILALFLTNFRLLLKLKIILRSIFLLLLGLLPYLYIPLAASKNPSINWGKASTLNNFFYLILRRQYGWGNLNINETQNFIYTLNIKNYFDYWSTYVPALLPVLIILGFIYLVLKRKYVLTSFFFTLIVFLGPFFSFYNRTSFSNLFKLAVIERFYISSIMIGVVMLPFGIELIYNITQKLLKYSRFKIFIKNLIIITFSLIPITTFVSNSSKLNLKNIYIGDNLAKDIMDNLPKDSILLLSDDSSTLNSIYLQNAYKYRQDIIIPGSFNGFYILLKANGWSDEKIYEYQLNNQSTIDRDLFFSGLAVLAKERNVYSDVTFNIIDDEFGKLVTVPYGLIYKLEYEKYLPIKKVVYVRNLNKLISSYHLQTFKENERVVSQNLTLSHIKMLYFRGYSEIINYIENIYNDKELANTYIGMVKELK